MIPVSKVLYSLVIPNQIKVQETLDKMNCANYEIRLVKPVPDQASISRDAADPDGYVSTSDQYKGLSFKPYAESILEYPEKYFHVIVRRTFPAFVRKACDFQSSKVADKGYVVLTNAEQSQYFAVHRQMDGLGYLKKSF
jgi:hypothetical protein